MIKTLPLITLLALSFTASYAHAASVSSPNVTKGQWELEEKGTFENDDEKQNKWKHSLKVEYGLTERVKISLGGKIEKEDDDSLEYKATEVKVHYKVTGNEAPLSSAVQLGYEVNHLGDADDVGAKLILEKKHHQWKQQFNLGLEHEVGEKSTSGIELSAALGTYYQFENFEVGGEYYADFGRLNDHNDYEEQEHHIGPVVGFDIPFGKGEIETTLGYLAGLSDASSNHMFKYEFEYKF